MKTAGIQARDLSVEAAFQVLDVTSLVIINCRTSCYIVFIIFFAFSASQDACSNDLCTDCMAGYYMKENECFRELLFLKSSCCKNC